MDKKSTEKVLLKLLCKKNRKRSKRFKKAVLKNGRNIKFKDSIGWNGS